VDVDGGVRHVIRAAVSEIGDRIDCIQGNSSQVAQLVQAMAGFGGGSGAAKNLNAVPLSADTSQQQLLTTPQHA
jgi:hypothetical protein